MECGHVPALPPLDVVGCLRDPPGPLCGYIGGYTPEHLCYRPPSGQQNSACTSSRPQESCATERTRFGLPTDWPMLSEGTTHLRAAGPSAGYAPREAEDVLHVLGLMCSFLPHRVKARCGSSATFDAPTCETLLDDSRALIGAARCRAIQNNINSATKWRSSRRILS